MKNHIYSIEKTNRIINNEYRGVGYKCELFSETKITKQFTHRKLNILSGLNNKY